MKSRITITSEQERAIAAAQIKSMKREVAKANQKIQFNKDWIDDIREQNREETKRRNQIESGIHRMMLKYGLSESEVQ